MGCFFPMIKLDLAVEHHVQFWRLLVFIFQCFQRQRPWQRVLGFPATAQGTKFHVKRKLTTVHWLWGCSAKKYWTLLSNNSLELLRYWHENGELSRVVPGSDMRGGLFEGQKQCSALSGEWVSRWSKPPSNRSTFDRHPRNATVLSVNLHHCCCAGA